VSELGRAGSLSVCGISGKPSTADGHHVSQGASEAGIDSLFGVLLVSVTAGSLLRVGQEEPYWEGAAGEELEV
jgi:hypothetical protein